MRCHYCGPLPDDVDAVAHLSSDEHRNMVELDYHMRERVYIPPDEVDYGDDDG